jgi:uncharacterized membrane protein YcaP (DUF421 family)
MDVILRAACAFFLIFLLTRIVGRRELNSLEPYDLILLVVLGDLVQQGVTQSDYSVTGMVLAVGTIALLVVTVSYISFRFPRTRPILDGEPIVVIQHGKILDSNLRRERDTRTELAEEARMQQVGSLRGRQLGDSRKVRPDQLHPEAQLVPGA